MSWFNDLSSKVGDLSSKVQAAIPIDKEMIQKLTLTTDELSSERQVCADVLERQVHFVACSCFLTFLEQYIRQRSVSTKRKEERKR
jgi:hypothetical protein